MSFETSDDGQSFMRFRQEARAANLIRHPRHRQRLRLRPPRRRALLPGDGSAGGQDAGRATRGGPLSLDEAIAILGPLCEVVEASHDRGIVHRDIKPENVFLAPSQHRAWQVKLLDFGIAKFLGDEDEVTESRASSA